MDGYSRKVGARLRSLRKQRGLTLQQVEVLSNKRLKGSLLAAYERGDRNISVTRLHQIATLYSVPVNQLLPEELEGMGEPALPPKLAIDLTQLQGLPERQGSILSRHVARLQQQRHDFNTPVVTFRSWRRPTRPPLRCCAGRCRSGASSARGSLASGRRSSASRPPNRRTSPRRGSRPGVPPGHDRARRAGRRRSPDGARHRPVAVPL